MPACCGVPSLDERRGHLEAVAGMIMANRDRIREAMSDDFAVHPALFSDLIECLGVAGRAAYAIGQLDRWTADEPRDTDPGVFGTARAFIRYQPKGVIGNIVPWNFPFDLGVGPLVEMLAAGNRVIVKPSDFTPACGEVLGDMIAATFDPERVTVAVGGLELAKTFPTLPWDHLLYTGSPPIGRAIMKAAAENLTPVTLELGGKCPAIVTEGGLDLEAVGNILGTKMIKNGQMCISVDYVLAPRDRLGEFVDLARRYVQEHTPGYSQSDSCTGIITERHLDRLLELRQQAVDAGYEVVDLEDGATVDRDTRQMPLAHRRPRHGARRHARGDLRAAAPRQALRHPRRGDRVRQRRRATPRALRLRRRRDRDGRVLDSITSGGACVNTCAMQGALPPSASADPATAAWVATTASKASASSPTHAASSSAARATSTTSSSRPTATHSPPSPTPPSVRRLDDRTHAGAYGPSQ